MGRSWVIMGRVLLTRTFHAMTVNSGKSGDKWIQLFHSSGPRRGSYYRVSAASERRPEQQVMARERENRQEVECLQDLWAGSAPGSVKAGLSFASSSLSGWFYVSKPPFRSLAWQVRGSYRVGEPAPGKVYFQDRNHVILDCLGFVWGVCFRVCLMCAPGTQQVFLCF